MKNKLFTLAAALTLVAVIGGFYAAPVLAQVIKAALIKNVDERGRVPFMMRVTCADTVSCIGTGSNVPVGKRFVIEHISADTWVDSPGTITRFFVYDTNNSFSAFLHPELNSSPATANIYAINESGPFYVEAGVAPRIRANGNTGLIRAEAWLTGYLVDLSI